MKKIYQNILFLLIGLILGLKFSEYFQYSSSLLHSEKLVFNSDNNSNVNSISIFNETRILCWVLTGPKRHKTHALHIKNTWGQRCNKLLFISTEPDDQLETVQFAVPEGYDHLWLKTREAFKYIYDNHFDDADWFLKTDDDSYIVMENLREFLYPMSTQAPVYFGHKYQMAPYVKHGYMAGAAYVLSKEALYRFATQAYDNETNCKYEYQVEDFQLGICLENIGVIAGDSRDVSGSNRFIPLLYTDFYTDRVPNWFLRYQFYPLNSTKCFSDSAIAFHHIDGLSMYWMEYLLYYLRPYGLNRNFTLPQKFDMYALMHKWKYEKPINVTNSKLTNIYKIPYL